MFGDWFGDFGAVKAKKAAAKKRTLAKKTGKKSARIPQTRKVPPRKYTRKTAAFMPGGSGYELPYMPEEEGGWLTYGGGMGPTLPSSGRTVTIGKATPHTQAVCGCTVVRMKNHREALRCPGGSTGKGTFRFATDADIQRAKAADNVCTHVPILGGRRGPLSPEERARRTAKSRYTFKTSRGKVISLRKPGAKTLHNHVAYYYHKVDRRNKARGVKTLYAPSFADINGAYGNW
jgi:hypothetical protein